MIGYIRGSIEEIEEWGLVIDRGGIGFRIFMPGALLAQQVRIGDEVKIFTYLHVKEDAMQLYGFFTKDDLEVFKLLLNVNGIGPKAALGVLSGLTADELRFAVLSDDAATIAKAPGIGKKTAQKLILELKDKFSLEEAFESKLSHVQEKSAGSMQDGTGEAVQALVALGYSNTEALQAVRKVDGFGEMDTEEILKAALKHLL